MSRNNIAEQVKVIRKEKSWSQDQLAEAADLSLRTIQRVERNGKCSSETLLAIAGAFDIEVTHFTKSLKEKEHQFMWLQQLQNRIKLDKLSPRKTAIMGILLCLPAFYFVSANILKYQLGIGFIAEPLQYFYDDQGILKYFNLFSPFFLFGSLALAIFLNAVSIFQLHVSKSKNTITGTVSVKRKIFNLIAVGFGGLLMCILLGYAFVENYSDYILNMHF